MKVNGEEIFNAPNTIDAARLVGVTYECIQYARTGELKHLLYAGGYYALDVVDGPVARLLNQVTKFGAKLDPFIDKVNVATLGAAAAFRNEIDWHTAIPLATINGSNAMAAVIAEKRGTAKDVPKIGKRSQLGMNIGSGMNIIGNNLRANGPEGWQTRANILRYGGSLLANATAWTIGLTSSKSYWHHALDTEPQA